MVLSTLFERFREVLKSSEIFQNWLFAALCYVLINPRVLYKGLPGLMKALGRGCISVRCKSGDRVCIDPVLYGYVVRYYYEGFIREIVCDEKSNALTINGLVIKLVRSEDHFDLGSAKFKHLYPAIFDVFVKQIYGFANVSGRVVVDIGAFIGDSAIYFSLKGSRKVYAIEPHPGAYNEMLENIRLNNMMDKIVPINAALGSKLGKIKMPRIATCDTVSTYYGLGSGGDVEVPMITLGYLIGNYEVEPDVLKMDCEGCEFDVILNDYDYDNVRLFRELIFEYHETGNHKVTELLDKLSNDYTCDVIGKGSVGTVHCVRRGLANRV